MVPLALLNQEWRGDGKILLLEPRRLAARAAARRMAALLGEEPGETVGYAMRMDSRNSAKTRILVVTEGILARMILDDAELPGVSAIIFDEFHERSLQAELGRALTLDAADGFVRVVARRDDHRIVGWQAVGPNVSELTAAFTQAIEMCARLEDIAGTIHAHPTLSEAVEEAALKALGQGLHG